MAREKLVYMTQRQADGIMMACAIRQGWIMRECKAKRITVAQAYYMLRNLNDIEASLVSADLW